MKANLLLNYIASFGCSMYLVRTSITCFTELNKIKSFEGSQLLIILISMFYILKSIDYVVTQFLMQYLSNELYHSILKRDALMVVINHIIETFITLSLLASIIDSYHFMNIGIIEQLSLFIFINCCLGFVNFANILML